MGVRMEAILGRFSEDRAKLFLGCVHEARRAVHELYHVEDSNHRVSFILRTL